MNPEFFKNRVNEALSKMLLNLQSPSKRLKEAMAYAVLSDGKRLRPILVYLTAEALAIPLEKLDNVACAVECMHAYSLIHDDLPAMDDDDLRRGKPTCHRAFDEATAILAGDALQALAFQQIAACPFLLAAQKTAMLLLLSQACGVTGMVSGQALDLNPLSEYKELSVPELEQIHQLKTGVLLEACMGLATLADIEMNENIQQNLCSFASYLGLAFQMQDDYLDKYGETAVLGKEKGGDEKEGKTTYATLFSQTDLQDLIQRTYGKAMNLLAFLGDKANNLLAFTEYLSTRNY